MCLRHRQLVTKPIGRFREAGGHQRADRAQDLGDRIVLHGESSIDVPFQRFELLLELPMSGRRFPQCDERADDEDAHLDSARRTEHGCGHDRAVLGESERALAAAAPT